MRPTKRLPDLLRVTCFPGSAPLAGTWVVVTLDTWYKNPFRSIFGPADSHGVLVIARAQLLEKAEADRNVFAMDYGHPEVHWTGKIEVRVLNTSGIARALQAFEVARVVVDYPPAYGGKLTEMDALLRTRPNGVLRAEVTAVPQGSATAQSR